MALDSTWAGLDISWIASGIVYGVGSASFIMVLCLELRCVGYTEKFESFRAGAFAVLVLIHHKRSFFCIAYGCTVLESEFVRRMPRSTNTSGGLL